METNETFKWPGRTRSCIDGRFIKRTVDWVSERAGEVFDYRTGVGSSKAIIDSRYDRASFFDVIETSLKLHSIKEVWLIDHVDCGAYGGSDRFHDLEKEFHIKKLREAEELVKLEFPELSVRKVYVGWKTIEEVE